jgi:diguanylate cyclase (GGDEF)-like protein
LNIEHEARIPVKTICVMIGDVSYDYTLELMNGINDAADQAGARLFYMTGKQNLAAPVDAEREQETVSRYNSIYMYAGLIGADAVIISCGSITGFEDDDGYGQFLKRFEGSKIVVLQKHIAIDSPDKSAITIDNYGSFRRLMDHLILDHGYRRIAYVSGPRQHPEAAQRARAYRDGMLCHGLTVDDGLIAYGDLSGFVDDQVEALMTAHPDLEAIAFANDEMAKAGYRVCARRGLTVGQDIAITGFDDFSSGRSLTPPLTTISQNAYQTGRLALQQALALAAGERVDPVNFPTSLHIRSSCGCDRFGKIGALPKGGQDARQHLEAVLQNMRSDLISDYTSDGDERLTVSLSALMDQISEFTLGDRADLPNERELCFIISGFDLAMQSFAARIAERLSLYLSQMAEGLPQPGMINLCRILLHIQGFLFSYAAREAPDRYERFRGQAWFVPEFIRDLVTLDDEDESVFRSVVERMRGIGLNNLYICLLPEPKVLRESGEDDMPDRLLLASYLSGGDSGAYPRSKMPVFDRERPLCTLPKMKPGARLISFSIFSGDTQYGIFLCDADKEKIPLLHVAGLQLGILINFLNLKSRERLVGRELSHIRRRNEILNILSEYDPMCNVYNRRGFIEQAMRLNRENDGKRAFIMFIDIDHLKEINDTFGHAAGDDAILAVCDILKKTVRAGDLIARIGGDEFVGLFIAEKPDCQTAFRARLKDAFTEFNFSSGRPYYVEVSTGITDFLCCEQVVISRILYEADRFLYEDKEHKRASALKS